MFRYSSAINEQQKKKVCKNIKGFGGEMHYRY
jgi:hypothetical protein